MTRFFARWLPCCLFVIAVFSPPVLADVPAAIPAAGSSLTDGIDGAVRAAMTAQHLPGVVVLVAQHGTVVASRAYGYADVARRTPVTVDTRFEIGSITKQFTAACILQLAEAHRLSLDDPLGTYVPSYAIGKSITLRQLLGQTSGIPEYLGTLRDPSEASRPVTFDALLAHVASKPLLFAPGTKWAYSNTNYALLGRIVELVSHEPYQRYVRENIFARAHMAHAGFIGDGAEPAATAHGYWLENGVAVRSLPLDATWAAGAGAIVATAGDLLAWDDALLGGSIVAPADLALMRTGGVLPSGAPTGYGYGWIVDGTPAHPRIWHNGGTFGFSATNATYPADDQTVIVLTNLGYAAPISLVSAVFEGLHSDVAAAPTPAPGEDPAVTARVREWLGRFERGDIDRAQLAPQMDAFLTADEVAAVKASFALLGDPTSLVYTGTTNVPGVAISAYRATFASVTMQITIGITPGGKIAGYFVKPAL